MGSLTNDHALHFWLSEIQTHDQLRGGCTGPTIRGSVDGGLVYHRTAGNRRTGYGPVTLCHYLPEQKMFVLNGDAFTDASASRWQNSVRMLVQPNPGGVNVWPRSLFTRDWDRHGRGVSGVSNVPPRDIEGIESILLPFQALAGAGIDPKTVIAIHVEQDRWEEVVHPVGNPRAEPDKTWKPVTENSHERLYEQTIGGHRFQYRQTPQKYWVNNRTKKETSYPPYGKHDNYHQDSRWFTVHRNVWGMDINGIRAWRQLSFSGSMATWTERVHHLGGSLFSAIGPDGRRHRYVSTFDQLESPPMYFLAQLPDRAKATTVQEGVLALKPPLVAAAELKGLEVFRQGDVFAVETSLTDDDVYAQAKSRVRRDVVMSNVTPSVIANRISGRGSWPEPEKGEVREYLPCPCGCGHKRWTGNGIKAQHSLSIYRTGHTATEVVVGKGGATYIKGSMHHDPRIEEPGRMGEHRAIELTEGKWFLCVRNTVPRRKQRPEQQEQAA